MNRLNSWQKGQVSGIELEVNEYSRLESVKEEIRARVDTQVDAYGGTYYTQSVEEVNPQIFAWLDLLDMNVWVILFLMTGVAGFTMISGLLIIILERTNMIGVLKALGADNLLFVRYSSVFGILDWQGDGMGKYHRGGIMLYSISISSFQTGPCHLLCRSCSY